MGERGCARTGSALLGRTVALAGVAMCLAGGCSGTSAEDEQGAKIFVRQALQPDPYQCFPAPEPNWPALPFGTMDLVFTQTYEAMLLFGNQLATGQTKDANRVSLNTAHVELRTESGAILQSFSRSATGFADPGSDEPGWGVTAITLVPSGTLKPSAPMTLVASVRLEGKTLAGEVVETPSFEFTIKACDGCLIRYPEDADDPSLPGYQCVSYDAGDTPCVLGQDDPIDCRLCLHTHPRCASPTG